MKRIKVAQFGLGPIGLESLRHAVTQPWLEVVGAVDHDPQKAGRPLTEVAGLAELDGLKVARDLEELFRETPPEVILHTASSRAPDALAQVRPALEFGVAVASTCEELVFPAHRHPALAREYDAICRHTGARVVGAGVNPGFVMDVLPICLTSVCRTVERIEVWRVVNASTRRQPLQAKIGSGRKAGEFRAALGQGRAGHAGLQESVALLAHALGWALDEITEAGEPVLAERDLETKFFQVSRGDVCGIHQRAVGSADGVEKVVLDLQMFLEAPQPHDRVVVHGRPPLDVIVQNGVAGDDATIAALINAVPRLLALAPGLHLPSDLALPRWSGRFYDASRISRV